MVAEIGRASVLALIDEGADIVDVRPEAEFTAEHIPGAVHLWLRDIDGPLRDQVLRRDRPTVVY